MQPPNTEILLTAFDQAGLGINLEKASLSQLKSLQNAIAFSANHPRYIPPLTADALEKLLNLPKHDPVTASQYFLMASEVLSQTVKVRRAVLILISKRVATRSLSDQAS